MSNPHDGLPDPANGAWHLDKRIPLAMIGAILMQTAAFGFWIGQISNRLDAALETNRQQDVRIEEQRNAVNSQAISAATTAAKLDAVRESLIEMKVEQTETNRLLRDLSTNGTGP